MQNRNEGTGHIAWERRREEKRGSSKLEARSSKLEAPVIEVYVTILCTVVAM